MTNRQRSYSLNVITITVITMSDFKLKIIKSMSV